MIGIAIFVFGILMGLLISYLYRQRTVAVRCGTCDGSGNDKRDSEFDCPDCKGGGLLIFKTYLSKKQCQKNFSDRFEWYN